MSFSAPPIWMTVLLVLWVLQAGWSLYNVGRFYRRAKLLAPRGRDLPEGKTPDALVVLPVKGDDGRLAEHAGLMLRQVYNGTYRVVFTVESDVDPAHAAIAGLMRTAERSPACREAKLVVAGIASRGGQKVHNQLRALDEHFGEPIVVFADADAAMSDHWLSTMVYGAIKKRYPAATGYRWLVPTNDAWASHFASVINASVATMLGHHRRNMAWGGSMALNVDKVPLDTLREHWRGAISDDYQFTAAVRSTGGKVYFVPAAMTTTPVAYTWPTLLAFARRQFMITRIHAPYPYVMAALLPAIYLAACGVAIAGIVMGNAWALVTLGVVFALDVMRGVVRRAATRVLFDEPTRGRLRRAFVIDAFATPVWLAVQLALVLSAAVGRTTRWAGVTYRMDGPRDVVIVARDGRPGSR